MKKNYLCHYLHSSLMVWWTTRGWVIAPCCFTIDSGEKVNMNKPDWFGSLWPGLRRSNLNNEKLDPVKCKMCIQDEDVDKQSLRIGGLIKRGQDIDPMPNRGPNTLEIRLDFSCNLACYICDHSKSTFWRRYTDVKPTLKPERASENDMDEFLEHLDISNLDELHILGGEPFINNTHVVFLNKLEQKGIDLSKLELRYHTNGTIKVEQEVIEIWSRCRQVIVYFSLDDVDDGYEYQRHPGKWKNTVENIFWFRDNVPTNVLFRIERTVSLLNAHRLKLLDDWRDNYFIRNNFDQTVELNSHMAHGIFSMENISGDHFKWLMQNDSVISHLEKLYNIHNLKPKNTKSSQIKKFIESQDQKRKISIEKYFPEFNTFYSKN